MVVPKIEGFLGGVRWAAPSGDVIFFFWEVLEVVYYERV